MFVSSSAFVSTFLDAAAAEKVPDDRPNKTLSVSDEDPGQLGVDGATCERVTSEEPP